jgi:GT2 family glycosyltransferase
VTGIEEFRHRSAGGASLEVSVIIATYRRPESLRRCVEALRLQTLQPLEVIVVARQTDSETRSLLEAQFAEPIPSCVVLVHEPGVVTALNRGLSVSRGDVVAFTDDDTEPHVTWLERIVSRFALDPAIGAVGGRDVIHQDGRIVGGPVTRIGRVQWFGRRIGGHHLEGGLQEVQFLKGANMAFRREAIEGFDRRLRGLGAEFALDMDVSLAAFSRGWRVEYDPQVVVDHYPGPRFDGEGRAEQTLAACVDGEHNELYVLLKWVPWWQKPLVTAYALLVGTRAAPGVLLLVEQLLVASNKRAVLHRSRAAMRGRLSGVLTFLQSRASAGPT